MIKIEIVKEVKGSDGLWRFACGDVFFYFYKSSPLFPHESNDLSGKAACYWSLLPLSRVCKSSRQRSAAGKRLCVQSKVITWTSNSCLDQSPWFQNVTQIYQLNPNIQIYTRPFVEIWTWPLQIFLNIVKIEISECLWSIQVIYESQNISAIFHSGSADKLHTNLMKEIGEKHYNWLILIGFVAFLRCN